MKPLDVTKLGNTACDILYKKLEDLTKSSSEEVRAAVDTLTLSDLFVANDDIMYPSQWEKVEQFEEIHGQRIDIGGYRATNYSVLIKGEDLVREVVKQEVPEFICSDCLHSYE